MTECERLIANGTFSPDFFKPEVRCDFLVDENRKKIWAIELDLLKTLDAVCKKHQLTYFLVEGSLLGAVRHCGFVPWDDDIDVGMPRNDYNKLCNLAGEFSYPLFLQCPGGDGEYAYSYIKLRNSNTSAIVELFSYARFNHGISLDIFPLDRVRIDSGRSSFDLIHALNRDNSTCMRSGHPSLSDGDLQRVRSCVNRDFIANLKRIDQLASQFDAVACDGVGLITNTVYSYERHSFRKEDFAGVKYAKFEGLDCPLPIGYENILRTVYGDYMKLPSVEKRGLWHHGIVVNPDVSYVDMLPMVQKNKV